MKILHVTTTSRGGAGIAALRLHKGLCEAGIASAYLSTDKTINFENKVIKDSFFKYKRPSFLNKIRRKILRAINPTTSQELTTKLEKINNQLSYEIISLPFSPFNLENHPLVKEADIINLHWVSKIVDYPTFFKKNQKPIVWTLHDFNPFQGLFHYQLDKQNNPIANEIDKQIFEIKKEALLKCTIGAIVSPSEWLLGKEKESDIFNRFNTHVVINNSLGSDYNEIESSLFRNQLGIAPTDNVLLFSAATIDNPRKGLDLLIEALEKVSLTITLLTLGKGQVNISSKNLKVIPLGFKSSQLEIAKCFAAADVFVLPSTEDNLPNTMLESLAQGTPVICFSNGGMKEIIKEGFNGKIVPEISIEALSDAIEDFFKEKEKYNPKAIKKDAQQKFNHRKQAKAYIKVYRELI